MPHASSLKCTKTYDVLSWAVTNGVTKKERKKKTIVIKQIIIEKKKKKLKYEITPSVKCQFFILSERK